jgi:hypothetical protein
MKIDLENQNFPQFKLSTHQDLILFLIKNELLSTRFMNQLSTIGFDTSFFSIELGTAILSLMGFKSRTDALWEWYYNTVDSYATKVCLENHAAIRAVSFDFYIALQIKLHTEQG